MSKDSATLIPGRTGIPLKKYKPEWITTLLRQVKVEIVKGKYPESDKKSPKSRLS
jgi:hypothetical protein